MKIHLEGVENGVRYRVVSYPDRRWSGYRWQIEEPTDHLGGKRWEQSPGGFYDGCDDHPEGGVIWAQAAARWRLRPRD